MRSILPRSILSLLTTAVLAASGSLLLTGCRDGGGPDTWSGIQQNKVAVAAAINAEEPGDYWIGRRYYKVDYKFWGWIRRPGQPWKTAQLVMMNEQDKLAPDREAGHIGSDNNYEYKLYGDLSASPTVYEPASNTKYYELRLKRAELVSVAPPNIYHVSGATDPTRRVMPQPY